MDFSKMIDEELIFTHRNFSSREEAIQFLAENLANKGIVKKSFLNAVLEREKKYPTGIYLGEINVAIPHTDIKHVIKSGLSILTLNNPLKFNRMDDPDEEIPVHIIFLLAVSVPNEYVKFLSRLTRSFSNKEIIEQIYREKNVNKVATILKNILKEGE